MKLYVFRTVRLSIISEFIHCTLSNGVSHTGSSRSICPCSKPVYKPNFFHYLYNLQSFFIIKPTRCLISQIYFVMKLYMFRTVRLSIIRSLFTVHSAMVYVYKPIFFHYLYNLQSFFIIKPTRCPNFTNLFCHETLHVSDSSSVHHQRVYTVPALQLNCRHMTPHSRTDMDKTVS